MSITPLHEAPKPARHTLKDVVDQSSWKHDPVIGPDAHRSPIAIVQWILMLFGGVCILGFIAMFVLFVRTDATFEKGSELVKFMIQSLMPLVTLAVGYYLGDRTRQPPPRR